MKRKIYFIIGLLLLCILRVSHGSHIVGGNFQLIQLSKGSAQFRLSLIMFFDEKNGNQQSKDLNITVGIFRKRDNVKMDEITLPLNIESSVVYANQACADQQSLKTLQFEYSKDIFLPPATYNDPSGYFVVWERCCRNSVITNINSPGATGQTFYLSFPPTTMNNSTPQFKSIDGEYICIGSNYKLLFDATDPDGDQLSYRLVAPYKGTSNLNSPLGKYRFALPLIWVLFLRQEHLHYVAIENYNLDSGLFQVK